MKRHSCAASRDVATRVCGSSGVSLAAARHAASRVDRVGASSLRNREISASRSTEVQMDSPGRGGSGTLRVMRSPAPKLERLLKNAIIE